ncbi:hypothetical protein [Sulfobacillus harzensis]|uniref:Uncharacterized protein n=1 Tax=Sulfobacillus harzensis TaxID=2729629 RepID=A0A7Y0L1U4_9FIRM|nr:hypothetical protein [Sulfobacillus harzensis]NMP21747.1 hypothetical protein [Sulfobacillus harzensis]
MTLRNLLMIGSGALALSLGLAGCGQQAPVLGTTSSAPANFPKAANQVAFFSGNRRILVTMKSLTRKEAAPVMKALTPQPSSEVFQHHASAIRGAYAKLPKDAVQTLQFAHGTAFTVSKVPVERSARALARTLGTEVLTFSSLPSGWRMRAAMVSDKGGTLSGNELFQPSSHLEVSDPAYTQFSGPNFAPSQGDYLDLTIQPATGVHRVKIEGGFSQEEALGTSHGTAVIVQYQPWWTPAPNLTEVTLGMIHQRRYYLVTLRERGLSTNQVITLAESFTWSKH